MKVVCNTSPIIILKKVELLWILPKLFKIIEIPKAVIKELEIGVDGEQIRKELEETNGFKIVELSPPLTPLGSWQLGSGESEVIEWGRINKRNLLLLDDKLARKIAELLGLSVCGTLGILVMAYKHKLIKSFSEEVIELKKAGLYFDKSVIEKIEKQLNKSY